MSVFSKENKRKDYKLVATSLPPRDFSYLSLYTLAKGITKATIMRTLIEEWINKNRPSLPETTLVQSIITHLNMRWKIHKSQKLLLFNDYKDIVKQELTEKCIKDTHIIIILSELKQ